MFAGRLLTASHVSALIEDFDQKAPCLIYIEMIPLLVEKIRINRFPWDSRWESFEAVQSRGVENVSKIAPNASGKRLFVGGGESGRCSLRSLPETSYECAFAPSQSVLRPLFKPKRVTHSCLWTPSRGNGRGNVFTSAVAWSRAF